MRALALLFSSVCDAASARDKGVHYLNTRPARSALESQQKFNLVQPIIQKCRSGEERKRCGASKLNFRSAILVNKKLHKMYISND